MKAIKTKKSVKKFTINIKDILSDVSPYDMIPTIESFEGIELNRSYKTTNYDLIKFNPLNRVEQKRIDKFKKLINSGKFYHKSTLILVDYVSHMINDGHHKVKALAELGKPIIFMLCDLGSEFRGERSAEHIAKYNDSNSGWNSKQRFKLGIDSGYIVANTLKAFKTRLDSAEPTNNFREWNILNFALGKNCESGVSIEDYRNSKINKILTRKSFERDFKSLISIIGRLEMMVTGIRTSETLKRLSVLNGKGDINIIEFAQKFNVHYKTFKPESKNVKHVDSAINSILKKRI